MKYCLLILTLSIFSCSSEPDYADYLRQMDIVLTDSSKVLSHNTGGAIGDFTVDFKLKISDKDLKNIITKIKQTENYGEYKSGDYPNSFSGIGNNHRISGFKLDNTYFYRKENSTEPTHYELTIDADKTLNFTYSED